MNKFYLEPSIEGTWHEAQTYTRYNGGGRFKGSQTTVEGDVLTADVRTGRYHDASMRTEPMVVTQEAPNTVHLDL